MAHIVGQRLVDELGAIVDVLRRRVFNPDYCGRELHDERRFFIIERVLGRPQCWLRICFKFVSEAKSHSGSDEIWISTLHLMRGRSLQRMLRNARFAVREIDGGH